MAQSPTHQTRSKRKPVHQDPDGIAKMRRLLDGREVLDLTIPFDPMQALDEAIDGLASQIGVLALSAALESDIEREAGPKHAHLDGRTAYRHGYEEGWIWYNGRKLAMKRPRARTSDGEVDLPR